MCLFSAVFQSIPECPLLILSNRDEYWSRPSQPPQIVVETNKQIRWMGGLDATAGGTWLGINQSGLLVAITNRPLREEHPRVRSRGLLCRDLLGCRSLNEALEELEKQKKNHPYAGFNVLLLTVSEAVIVENADESVLTALSPGIHIVSNGTLNDPDDPRVTRARSELDQWDLQKNNPEDLADDGKRICGLPANAKHSGICVREKNRGSVSSTIVALTENPENALYWYASGPPAETPYADHSKKLRHLLTPNTQ